MTGHRMLGLTGTVSLTLTGACPEECLTALTAQGVRFREFRKPDELTIALTVSDRDMAIVRRCAKRQMCSVEIIRVSGPVPLLRAMGWRVAYPLALLSLGLLVLWLQGHIWFFTVTGNETVPTERILWVLEENGVGFFTDADSLDMNTLKNQVLADLPELGWITVNTQGCTAQVIVREREEKPVLSGSSAPANVLARKSGLITHVEVTGGTAQVEAGDVVLAGDLLISGVTNLDKTVLLTRAEGEVYARTWSTVEAVLPDNAVEKAYTGRQTARYSVTFGKKTINFYKSSGISYGNYDKIMESKTLALPGGYTFPVTVTKTVLREYVSGDSYEGSEALLEASALAQIRLSLTAGSILRSALTVEREAGGLRLRGVVECQEEIGIVAEIKD